MRVLATVAILSVILQGVLGGLRVIEKNIVYAMVHACLGQAFFCLLIVIAWGTSAAWKKGVEEEAIEKENGIQPVLFRLSFFLAGAIFIQLIIGAIMRHTMAGLAIPTFPTVFGGILPPVWNFSIGIHFFHRVGALVILALSVFLFLKTRPLKMGWIKNLSNVTLALIFFQGLLGASIIWTTRAAVPTTAHVLGGALVLACAVSSVFWLVPRGRKG